MFAAKFSCLAALALAPWAQALLLQIPVDWQSSSPANVSWTNTPTDPPFTLELVNTDEFHDTFGIANNVNPSADFISLTLPVIPQGYAILLVCRVKNQNQIFDETPSFTIQGPPDTSSHSSAASTSASASASSATSAKSATLTVPVSSGTAAAASTSGFGVTVSNSNTGSASSVASTGAAAASSSGAASSNFNGAASLPNLAPWAIAALGVVAGAAAAL
ncbi:hypothetical protein BD309DRAFT_1064747 [Dichomitus squalens]|uniref:Uncharacterized protein n=1 Tax=Dichomitus squalens TaxID=114155 RepID=A0A4Q9PAU9_9APHY|nr:hypothetical protein BD309DRAFT_1064747 [Dichomitus squalens]TBU62163.1 hypothetical protein BD310DRAFT_946200 [Dichomitus squalens]